MSSPPISATELADTLVRLHRLVEEGWSVSFNKHADRSGPDGAPKDPEFPEVYTVHLYRSGAFKMTHVNTRHGDLVFAMNDACRKAEEKSRR